jgi:hypothetical protein
MKISNPLTKEHSRLKTYSLWVALLTALLMAVVNYMWSRADLKANQQSYLTALSKDVEHQLAPLLFFGRVQQRDINSLFGNGQVAEQVSQGIVGVVDTNNAAPLSPAEMGMLNQLLPVLNQQMRVMPFFQQWTYLSAGGRLFQPQEHDLNANAVASHALSYIRALPALQQHTDELTLIPPVSQPGYFVLITPLRHNRLLQGYLLLTVDLATMMQTIKLQHPSDTLLLLDNTGQVMLAVQDGRVADQRSFDGIHQHDQVQSVDQWPLALHVQADSSAVLRDESTRFLLQMVSFTVPLLLLMWFWLSRFKSRTLRPFARMLTHVDRLHRGDLTGVRHVPPEWDDVFNQIRRLKFFDEEKHVE